MHLLKRERQPVIKINNTTLPLHFDHYLSTVLQFKCYPIVEPVIIPLPLKRTCNFKISPHFRSTSRHDKPVD